MAAGRFYDFEVEGFGDFPFDMLRYDECWPIRDADVKALADKGRRRVRLRTSKPPTQGRWESFLWNVREVV